MGVELDGAADHGVSEALYLRDPDGNGVEFYWDRPKEKWPHTPAGELAMFTHPLDLDALLAEARQLERRAQRSFAGAERGLERCSSGVARMTSSAMAE